jgi:hypothetical protein
MRCANCGNSLPDDPNEAEDIVKCRYCDLLFCSEECADEHGLQAHPGEALSAADDNQDHR